MHHHPYAVLMMPDAPSRRALVFERILQEPGIHTRQLARDCGLALSTATHHLEALRREGKIVMRQDGRYRRIFLAGSDPAMMDMAAALRRRLPARVLAVMAGGDAWTRRMIAEATGISGSTLGGALTHLRRSGLLTRELRGGRFVYRACAPALIHEALKKKASVAPPEPPASPTIEA